MTNRQKLAEDVAQQLFATEEALDTALANAGDLVAMLPRARQQAGVSAKVGQAAIQQLAASLSLLAEARHQIVLAHQSLADSAGEARVTPRNFGGFIDKPAARKADFSIVGEAKAG